MGLSWARIGPCEDFGIAFYFLEGFGRGAALKQLHWVILAHGLLILSIKGRLERIESVDVEFHISLVRYMFMNFL